MEKYFVYVCVLTKNKTLSRNFSPCIAYKHLILEDTPLNALRTCFNMMGKASLDVSKYDEKTNLYVSKNHFDPGYTIFTPIKEHLHHSANVIIQSRVNEFFGINQNQPAQEQNIKVGDCKKCNGDGVFVRMTLWCPNCNCAIGGI